jgi:hypothetical protein
MEPRTQELFRFALAVILNPANRGALSLNHQIGGASISVIRSQHCLFLRWSCLEAAVERAYSVLIINLWLQQALPNSRGADTLVRCL